MSWSHNRRSKIIVDETLNFISSTRTSVSEIGVVAAAMTSLVGANEGIFTPLRALQTKLTNSFGSRQERNISEDELACIHAVDTDLILDLLEHTADSDLQLSGSIGADAMRRLCRRTMSSIRTIQNTPGAWISYSGTKILIHTSRLHPSFYAGGGVILDATAALHVGYELLNKKLRIVTPPKALRSYNNVTMHVSRGHKVGKYHMINNAIKQWPTFRKEISRVVSPTTKLLVCCHKDVKEQLEKNTVTEPNDSFAHWNNIDGKNEWRDHEAIALFGPKLFMSRLS